MACRLATLPPADQRQAERFHETLKARLNLLVSTSLEALHVAMAEFIKFYNYRCHHEEVGPPRPQMFTMADGRDLKKEERGKAGNL